MPVCEMDVDVADGCEPPRIEETEQLRRECDWLRLERAASLGTAHAPMQQLPDDMLQLIFEQFQSAWGPWVPWAPVGWTPPPPLTPKHLTSPHGVHEPAQQMEREDFNTLRQNLCLVSK